MRSPIRLAAAALALVTGAAVLAGCGSDDAGSATGSAAGSATPAPAATVAVTTKLGTARVPANPKRVVALGWGSADAALALGVVPVGMEKIGGAGPSGIFPWEQQLVGQAKPELVETVNGIPYEKIAALAPDVILAVYSGITAEQYGTLSKIAPTVGYPGEAWSTSWQDQIRLVGQALGRSEQAAQLTEETKQAVAAQAAAHPEFRGRTAVFGSAQQTGTYFLYRTADPRMQLLADLGFTLDDTADTVQGGDGTRTFATALSLEQLPSVRAQVLVAWYPSAAVAASVAAQPTFAQMAAVKAGSYVPVTDELQVFAFSAPNILSIPWLLDRYVPQLQSAVAKV